MLRRVSVDADNGVRQIWSVAAVDHQEQFVSRATPCGREGNYRRQLKRSKRSLLVDYSVSNPVTFHTPRAFLVTKIQFRMALSIHFKVLILSTRE